MSTLTEISLTSMKAAVPAAPDPIQGISTLASLIDLMLHLCRCSQTQKTPASATMNMLFCAVSPGLYSFFTNKTYPQTIFRSRQKSIQSQISLHATQTTSARQSKLPTPATEKQEQTSSP